ncbi:DNRLRE domain-containing protein [Paenibacillus sp. IB182496]|uniref:DNRLRE domain-containing protein n=1 Tax=Paenibacillus sabuli TaxID=2772509 RepID=A0A927BVV7_9BACL|nr:heparinase II/III family protein [Paenibacillus sabuli]MBD2846308.1 DNRLRE domain-containing protein [Paenibacillus sabuli]
MMEEQIVDWKVGWRYTVTVALCAALLLTGAGDWLGAGAQSPVAHALDADGHLTDAELFGAWEETSATWTTVGKLNYGYSPELAPVEAAVKLGDYALAKQRLLAYYETREGFTAFPLIAHGTFQAELIADNILWRAGGTATPEAVFAIGETAATHAIDVTAHVQSAAQGSQSEVSYLLMGRYKDDDAMAEFASSEASAHAPELVLTAGGQAVTVGASQDTYVHAGAAGQTHGADTSLYVQDSGIAANAALDTQSRRAYLTFPLPSALPGPITAAELRLHGQASAGSGGMEILLVKNGYGYDESTLTWNNASADIFSYNGLPGGPDWTNPQGAQNEYMWTTTRFQFFGELVGAYAATGDEHYAEQTVRLMTDFMDEPSAYLAPHTSQHKRSIDVSFRPYLVPRMLEHLYGSPHLTAEAMTIVVKNMWQTLDWLNNAPEAQGGNNWSLIEAKGIYAGALYFPEFSDAAGWADTQQTRIDKQMARLVFLDGGYSEATYNYSLVALQVFWDFRRLADLYGDEMTPTFNNTIHKLARYMMDFTLPNGYSPVYGDGGYARSLDTYLQIADAFGDEELEYVASLGVSGTAPEHTSSYYPDTKQVTMRTGWEEEDRYLLFTNSAGPHGHMDQNALIAYADGKVLLTDTGVNDYLSANPISSWQFDNVESHNTIRIDGLPMHKYHNLSAQNTDTMAYRSQGAAFDYSEGTTYATAGFAHTRSVLFVKPNYWIVSDLVESTMPSAAAHTYEQNWHLLPGAVPTMASGTLKTATHVPGEPNLQIVPAHPGSYDEAELKDGWYGTTASANARFAQYTKQSAGPVTFDTVLYPTSAGESRDIATASLAVAPASPLVSALEIDLDDGGRTAQYYRSHEPTAAGERTFGAYAFDGRLAYVERAATGEPVALSLVGGTALRQDGAAIVASPHRIADLGVRWAGATVELYGAELAADTDPSRAIAIYAPGTTGVELNGEPVSFTAVGDYIYAARAAVVEYDYAREFSATSSVYGWQYTSADEPPQPLEWQEAGSGGFQFGTDEFDTLDMKGHWQHILHQDRPYWSVTEAPGKLRITAQPGDLWAGNNNQKNLMLQTPFFPDYRIETKLSFDATHNYQAAGLLLYTDDDNYIKLERAYHSGLGGPVIRLVREFQTAPDAFYRSNDPHTDDPYAGDDLYLRLTKRGLDLRAEYSGDGVTWTRLGDDLRIPADTMKIGLHAMNTEYGNGVVRQAEFDYFRVTQLLPDRWVRAGNAASSPIATSDYIIPGTSHDAVQRWVAPADGTVQIAATVASHNAYTGGDGFQVKVTKNGANIWPQSGYREVDRSDMTGYAIGELVPVEQGDVLAFVTNRVANAQYDTARWTLRLTMLPGVTADVSRYDGSDAGWTPRTGSRWTAGPDGMYALTASGYAPQSGDRPGEYALRDGADAHRFRLSMQVRLDDELASHPQANAVVLFNYQDSGHYYYVRLDNDSRQVRLYMVDGGVATVLADSDGTDWVTDNDAHTLAIARDDATGSIIVAYDGRTMLRASDDTFSGGAFGIGSMDGAVSFDDVGIAAWE